MYHFMMQKRKLKSHFKNSKVANPQIYTSFNELSKIRWVFY